MDFGIDGGDGLVDGVVAGEMDGGGWWTVGWRNNDGAKVRVRIF